MSLLRAFSLFVIAFVLTPLHSKHTPLALAVDWNLGRDASFSDGDPSKSDYPSEPEMASVFSIPERDKAVIWADIDENDENSQVIYNYCQFGKKVTMFNSFPSTPKPHYLARRSRSWSWFLASIRSAMQMYLRALSGEVTLISPKDGPRGGCDEFWNYVFPEIEANKDVLFITLIDIQNPFGPGILYWRKGDPPPTPPRGPAGPNNGPGGDGSGIVIRLPPSTRDPRNDVWNLAGDVTAATAATALLSGDVTAALLHGLPPAATIMKDGLSGLNAATSQGQFIPATSSDPWIGPVDSFGLGE